MFLPIKGFHIIIYDSIGYIYGKIWEIQASYKLTEIFPSKVTYLDPGLLGIVEASSDWGAFTNYISISDLRDVNLATRGLYSLL